jgi:hypothetical protein
VRASIPIFAAAALFVSAAVARAEESGAAKLSPKAAEAVERARSAQPVKAPATSGLKAAKNDDGRLRAPSSDEDAALRGGSDGPVRVTSVRVNSDGSVVATLGDEHLSDLVAVKGADGKVTTVCTPHPESQRVVDGKVSLPAPRSAPEVK